RTCYRSAAAHRGRRPACLRVCRRPPLPRREWCARSLDEPPSGESDRRRLRRGWPGGSQAARRRWWFKSRYKKVLAAKQEIAGLINSKTIEGAKVIKGTATDLSAIPTESIDYIYTDPPYGSKIPYLDLSIMFHRLARSPYLKKGL